jgi:tryptophan-rich sensory protein
VKKTAPLEREVLYVFKKKYGKMTVNAWLVSEMEATRPWVMLLGGILLTAGGILVRLFCGSPYRRMLELGIAELTPPVWLMTLLWTVAFFTVGCAGGFVLGYRVAGCDGEKYKGCMLFVLFAVLELCWYPTLFGAGLLFLSVLECIAILCFAVGTTVSFYRVSKFAGLLLLMHVVWLCYLLILNFAIFFGA